jgi:hypothetical protein
MKCPNCDGEMNRSLLISVAVSIPEVEEEEGEHEGGEPVELQTKEGSCREQWKCECGWSEVR